jgi:hypothetical protein
VSINLHLLLHRMNTASINLNLVEAGIVGFIQLHNKAEYAIPDDISGLKIYQIGCLDLQMRLFSLTDVRMCLAHDYA